MIDVTQPAQVLSRIRDDPPLVPNITNLVAMDLAANSLRVLEQNFPEHEVTAQARNFHVTQ